MEFCIIFHFKEIDLLLLHICWENTQTSPNEGKFTAYKLNIGLSGLSLQCHIYQFTGRMNGCWIKHFCILCLAPFHITSFNGTDIQTSIQCNLNSKFACNSVIIFLWNKIHIVWCSKCKNVQLILGYCERSLVVVKVDTWQINVFIILLTTQQGFQ